MPRFSEVLKLSMVSLPNISEISFRVVFSLPPKNSMVSQLPTIVTMDGGMCILQLRGVRPFFSKKYDITKHPRYKYLSDADKKNTFDVERYIRVQRKKKKHPSAVIAPEDPFDLYEIELSDEDADFTAAE